MPLSARTVRRCFTQPPKHPVSQPFARAINRIFCVDKKVLSQYNVYMRTEMRIFGKGGKLFVEENIMENENVTMKDMEQELEASYQYMGDGEHDTDTILAWNKIMELYEAKEVLTVTVCGIVNKGVIAEVEGIRGFIPASRLALKFVEDLNDYLGKEVRVRIITADRENDKLVLSAKELLQEAARADKQKKVADIAVGSVMDGKVETLKDYGAFIDLGDGISGLVHISQISDTRIKHPSAVLKEGQDVKVKVIKNEGGKLSLSIRALIEEKKEEEEIKVEIPKSENIGTSFADLLKNIKL